MGAEHHFPNNMEDFGFRGGEEAFSLMRKRGRERENRLGIVFVSQMKHKFFFPKKGSGIWKEILSHKEQASSPRSFFRCVFAIPSGISLIEGERERRGLGVEKFGGSIFLSIKDNLRAAH